MNEELYKLMDELIYAACATCNGDDGRYASSSFEAAVKGTKDRDKVCSTGVYDVAKKIVAALNKEQPCVF